jgi:hypothetical protein
MGMEIDFELPFSSHLAKSVLVMMMTMMMILVHWWGRRIRNQDQTRPHLTKCLFYQLEIEAAWQ